MRYEKWFRQIRGPKASEFTKDVNVILVGLAGYFGRDSKMRPLAADLKEELDNDKLTIAPVCGVGRFSSRMRTAIARRIKNAIKRIEQDGGKTPKVIFFGKSMGASVLRDVCMTLSREKIHVDLFVAVDASRRLGYHYQNYTRSNGNTEYAMQFPRTVNKLVNLHEWRKRKAQNGHPCLYCGTRNDFPNTPYIDLDLNINVHHHGFNKQTLSVDPAASPITSADPHHMDISENDDVLGVVKDFVRREIKTLG